MWFKSFAFGVYVTSKFCVSVTDQINTTERIFVFRHCLKLTSRWFQTTMFIAEVDIRPVDWNLVDWSQSIGISLNEQHSENDVPFFCLWHPLGPEFSKNQSLWSWSENTSPPGRFSSHTMGQIIQTIVSSYGSHSSSSTVIIIGTSSGSSNSSIASSDTIWIR